MTPPPSAAGDWAEAGAEALGPSRAAPGRVVSGHLLLSGANGGGRSRIRASGGAESWIWGPEALDAPVQSLGED